MWDGSPISASRPRCFQVQKQAALVGRLPAYIGLLGRRGLFAIGFLSFAIVAIADDDYGGDQKRARKNEKA